MAEQPESQVRRRRSSGNPQLPLNLAAGYQVSDSASGCQGTPSPSCVKFTPNSRDGSSSAALAQFRKKQQSFEVQIEECEEEEILLSDEDGAEDEVIADRPVTPTPIQDFAANVSYKEGPQTSDFLKVAILQTESITDVSEAESDGEDS